MIELYAYCGVCGSTAPTEIDNDDGSVVVFPCTVCAKRNRKDNKALQFLLDLKKSVTWIRMPRFNTDTLDYTYSFKISEDQYRTMEELMKENSNERINKANERITGRIKNDSSKCSGG